MITEQNKNAASAGDVYYTAFVWYINFLKWWLNCLIVRSWLVIILKCALYVIRKDCTEVDCCLIPVFSCLYKLITELYYMNWLRLPGFSTCVCLEKCYYSTLLVLQITKNSLHDVQVMNAYW